MPSTVLTKRTAHQERQESAAIWDFNPAHDPLASKPKPLVNPRTSAFASCGHAVAYALARFVPTADISRLFDNLVGRHDDRVGHGQSKRLGGLHVNYHLELGWSLDRQIGWPGALKDAIHVVR
jgi:hypothetical protein